MRTSLIPFWKPEHSRMSPPSLILSKETLKLQRKSFPKKKKNLLCIPIPELPGRGCRVYKLAKVNKVCTKEIRRANISAKIKAKVKIFSIQ